MTTYVLIMANGPQRRLAHLVRPKTLLRLDRCNETILERTIRLVSEMLPAAEILIQGNALVQDAILPAPAGYMMRSGLWKRFRGLAGSYPHHAIEVLTFERPTEALEHAIARSFTAIDEDPLRKRVIVLMGDVVYSRNILCQILADTRPVLFVANVLQSGAKGASPLRGISAIALDWREMPLLHERMTTQSACEPDWWLVCGDWTRGIDTPFDITHVLPELDLLAYTEESEMQREACDKLAAHVSEL
jgi:hypothetical protein